MNDVSHRVGAALSYLVGRMESFCAVTDSDVLLWRNGDVGGIPTRMPTADVLRAQVKHYWQHRHLYPETHQELLDDNLSIIGDQQAMISAVDGFTKALADRSPFGGLE